MRKYGTIMALSLALSMLVGVAAQATGPARSAEQFEVNRTDLARIDGHWVESIDLLFNVAAGGILSLGTSTGSVDVRTWSQDKVRLIITKQTGTVDAGDAKRLLEMFRVSAVHGGKDVKVTARARSNECAAAVGVRYTVWVPRSFNLDIKTKSGSIGIPEINGNFSAHTADGSITVDCDTENLDIEVEDHQNEDGKPVEPASRGSDPKVRSFPVRG